MSAGREYEVERLLSVARDLDAVAKLARLSARSVSSRSVALSSTSRISTGSPSSIASTLSLDSARSAGELFQTDFAGQRFYRDAKTNSIIIDQVQ